MTVVTQSHFMEMERRLRRDVAATVACLAQFLAVAACISDNLEQSKIVVPLDDPSPILATVGDEATRPDDTRKLSGRRVTIF